MYFIQNTIKKVALLFNIGEGYMEGTLIVGREHIGDENGQTRYAYKKLYAKAKKDKEWTLLQIISPNAG